MNNLGLREGIAVVVGLLIVVLFFLFSNFLEFSGAPAPAADNEVSAASSLDELLGDRAGQLVIEDLSEGEGEAAQKGDSLTVHYVGLLPSGVQFDSSIARDRPFEFVLGSGQVIAGWDEGLVGMKVGGERLLVIPPDLAYGDRATGSIPPQSTLIFQVRLLEIN